MLTHFSHLVSEIIVYSHKVIRAHRAVIKWNHAHAIKTTFLLMRLNVTVIINGVRRKKVMMKTEVRKQPTKDEVIALIAGSHRAVYILLSAKEELYHE